MLFPLVAMMGSDAFRRFRMFVLAIDKRFALVAI